MPDYRLESATCILLKKANINFCVIGEESNNILREVGVNYYLRKKVIFLRGKYQPSAKLHKMEPVPLELDLIFDFYVS